ncbi:MAG TPA: hypothetical protein VHV78_11265 [Gemmatimonadaceae bacterium]|nr:hypothetical protein [Gemmatimonadaceae bacterium]
MVSVISSNRVIRVVLFVSIVLAGCGGKQNGDGSGGDGGNGDDGGDDSGLSTGDGGADAGDCSFDVEPSAMQTIAVPIGTTSPTVTFTASAACLPVNPGWGVDKGNIGSVAATGTGTAVFTPTGTTGGLVTVSAGENGQTLTRQIFVKLTGSQNGPNNSAGETAQIPSGSGDLTSGGGVGGVGGEGLGIAVTDAGTLTALGTPTSDGSALGLTFLYPYNQTVWPRGMLAPLLMWSWSTGDADAIKIDLTTTTGSFTWSGTFGRPAILATTGGKFIHMPIPQDVWEVATNTAAAKTDELTVNLTVAKGGVAYGPISETWIIAPARLDGTIYYQSYGTQLIQNFPGAVGGNTLFGAAVLSIKVGDTTPKVAAGTATANPTSTNTGCRVCHSVASGGSRVVAVDGNDETKSSAYDLTVTPATQTIMTTLAQYPAMFPDGTMALTASGSILTLPTGAVQTAPTGLSAVATNLGEPAFSPDGTKLAFNPLAGPSGTKVNQGLYVMSFDKTSSTFSSPVLVADDTGQPSATQPSWPAFFPDNKSLVYHQQTIKSIEDNLATRAGSHAQIYWTSGNSAADVTPLDALNGKGYLPKLATPSTMSCTADGYQVAAGPPGNGAITNPDLDHGDDADLNYEPTVLPVGAGGYAWVIFTSRRLYGNEATIPPFCSDPRGVDLIQNITTKKLWVAAVDLSQAPGVDSSHPAFYLPAQELLAGNARGFWALDPCLSDGSSCSSGDQCCNGYCEAGGSGALVCSQSTNSCSAVGDKCESAANCCDPTNACLNGFCAVNVIQ